MIFITIAIGFILGLLIAVNFIIALFYFFPRVKKAVSDGELNKQAIAKVKALIIAWGGIILAVLATVLIRPFFNFLFENYFYHAFFAAWVFYSIRFSDPRKRRGTERLAERYLETFKKTGKWTA
jgi:hypothetical protein